MQKMKIDFGSCDSVITPEIALVTVARQKYDATGNFGTAIPVGAVVGGTSPDDTTMDRYQQGRIPHMGYSSFLLDAPKTGTWKLAKLLGRGRLGPAQWNTPPAPRAGTG